MMRHIYKNILCFGSSYSSSELDRTPRQFIDDDKSCESHDCFRTADEISHERFYWLGFLTLAVNCVGIVCILVLNLLKNSGT